MKSQKDISNPILLAGVALILQDVSPEQLEIIKKGIESVTGKSALTRELPSTGGQSLPPEFEKLIENRAQLLGPGESAPSTNL